MQTQWQKEAPISVATRCFKFMLKLWKQCCNLKLNAEIKRWPDTVQGIKFPLVQAHISSPIFISIFNLFWSQPTQVKNILYCNQLSYLTYLYIWLKSFTNSICLYYMMNFDPFDSISLLCNASGHPLIWFHNSLMSWDTWFENSGLLGSMYSCDLCKLHHTCRHEWN